MNLSFLDQLADIIKKEYGEDIEDLCIVLPSRRAVVFMKEALAKAYGATMWSPQITSVQDFIRNLTPWQFPEPINLIFELYKVYSKKMKEDDAGYEEAFERFYSWGEMLLNDFDEVDKYLADAKGLFTNIRDLKEIEAMFGITEEEIDVLRNFWRNVQSTEEGTEEEIKETIKEKFLKIWEILFDVYHNFRESLSSRHLAYDGMAYRYVAEGLKAETLDLDCSKVIFAGFNALSGAEEQIIKKLLDEKQAVIYWDMDVSFLRHPKTGGDLTAIGEEAGKFVRLFHDKWKGKGSYLITEDMGASKKNIYLTGVPLQVSQAHYLGNLVNGLEGSGAHLRQHAIVLADENLLFPVLYSLPSDIEALNITMGFPLKHTNIYHLLMSVNNLMRNLVENTAGHRLFPHKEVNAILNNPYIKSLAPDTSNDLQQKIHTRNLVLVPEAFFSETKLPPLLNHIFHPPLTRAAILPYFDELFDSLIGDAQEQQAYLEAEYIFHFFTYYNHLKSILSQLDESLSTAGFAHIFREVMRKGKIPFQGEPLAGLQLMGFLETRVLDFENVYVLGANEGSLPDTSSGNSFIPYNLRKGFRLPTYDEKDAIFAYHFFRLLMRAKNVHLIYNSNVSDQGSAGEISRYLRQIRHFAHAYPGFKVHEEVVASPAPFGGRSEIVIPATEETRKVLTDNYAEGKGYFSATALTTYLACPLRFYYRYVARIKEPEALEENMEAGTFGSVLHLAMEYMYGDFVGKRVAKSDIEEIGKNLDVYLEKAFVKENLGWGESLTGKNYLFRDAIRKLCKEILRQDHQSDSFEVAHLEEEKKFLTTIEVQGKSFRVNGKFDRVDLLPEEGTIRILDYKTGDVSFSKPFTVDNAFHPDTMPPSSKGLKEAFQGFLYAWLFSLKFPDNPILVGYYTARKLKEGVVYLNGGKKLSDTYLAEVKTYLRELIEKIISLDFTQTEDEKKCGYCPYRGICNRG